MPKRSSKKPPEAQPAQTEQPAPSVQPTSEPNSDGKNPAAVTLGRLGGKKGGPARAAKLTKEQRAEIAKRAAQARWAKRQSRSD
jgi:hypothetical protein